MAISQDFQTTAALQANVFSQTDVGNLVRDLEKGSIYMVVGAGAGSAYLSAMRSTQYGYLTIPLNSFRLVSSGNDVGNIAAIGGVGASDSAPILRGDAANSIEWSWATGNVVAIGTDVAMPADYDGSIAGSLEMDVYSGTTDKATMTAATCCDGGTETTRDADDTATKSATNHTITATLAAADIPDSVKKMSLRITPSTAHATNAYQLTRVMLRYTRK